MPLLCVRGRFVCGVAAAGTVGVDAGVGAGAGVGVVRGLAVAINVVDVPTCATFDECVIVYATFVVPHKEREQKGVDVALMPSNGTGTPPVYAPRFELACRAVDVGPSGFASQ